MNLFPLGAVVAVFLASAAICGARENQLPVPQPDSLKRGPELVSSIKGTYTAPPKSIPTGKMAGGPVVGNGDLGVVMGGPADHLTLYLGKNDFFGVIKGGMAAVGSLNLSIPELKEATSYLLEQNIGPARITGSFSTTNGSRLTLDSWVASRENLLVLTLRNEGTKPLTITSQLLDGLGTPGNTATRRTMADRTALQVSPDILHLELGNRLHDSGSEKPKPGAIDEKPFTGEIADFRLYDRNLTAEELNSSKAASPILHWSLGMEATTTGDVQLKPNAPHGGSILFHGNPSEDLVLGALLVPQRQWTLSVWINPSSIGKGLTTVATACVNAGEPKAHGLRLLLLDGKPSVTLNRTSVTAPASLQPNQWVHLTASYDGTTMRLQVDDKTSVETRDFPTADQVMGADVYSVHFGDPKLPYEGCSTRGLMAQRAVEKNSGIPITVHDDGLGLTLNPGGEVTLGVSVVTDRNIGSYESEALRLVDEINPGNLEKLAEEHDWSWRDFWSKSFVEIPDKTIQESWYGSLYLLACCSRAGCPPPGLWGNFVTVPEMAWDGDYTLNYNFEAPFWGAYACNHPELAESYESPLLESMPRGRAIALKFQQQGLYYYMHIIPVPGWSNGGKTFQGQKSGTLFSSLNCIMRWRYTRDLAYARRVYPFLKGTADFWDKALVLRDGYYVDPKDCAAEGKESDTPATTLAFLRQLYPTMIELSSLLQVDQDRVPAWKVNLEKLSPLPIVPAGPVDHLETSLDFNAPRPPAGQRATNNPAITLKDLLGPDLVKDRMVIRNAVSGYGFPFPMVHAFRQRQQRTSGPGMSSCHCIFPGWAIGMESSPLERKAALDTITLSAQWYDFNNQCSFYPGAACAGYDPKEILENLHELISRYAYPNFMIHAGGGGTENFAVTPATLASMFLQSYQQNIHLFPDWPADQDASFGNLNACGGFLVSSRISHGEVVSVTIESTAGQPCRLVNPWKEKAVSILSNRGSTFSEHAPLLTFPTRSGEVFEVQPASPLSPPNSTR